MKLFDSHCHIDDRSFKNDLNDVFERSQSAGVKTLMVVGISEKSSKRAVELARTYENCYASVGIHPHDAKACSKQVLEMLRNLAKNPQVKAWGETGLDFNRMFSPQATQELWFIEQLEIAKELKLPLIFHERDSQGRFLDILKSHFQEGMRGVVHCFSGNQKELKAYLDLGLYIGITGILTIKSRGKFLRQLVREIPAERILIETDAPYLTPAPEKNRTRRNEPAFVKSTFLELAAVLNVDPAGLANILWDNTCRLFDIESR